MATENIISFDIKINDMGNPDLDSRQQVFIKENLNDKIEFCFGNESPLIDIDLQNKTLNFGDIQSLFANIPDGWDESTKSLNVKSVEITDSENLVFKVETEEGKTRTYEIHPNGLLIKEADTAKFFKFNDLVNVNLPSTIFSNITNKEVKCNQFPFQMFTAFENNPNNALGVETFSVPNTKIKLLKCESGVYIAQGSKLFRVTNISSFDNLQSKKGSGYIQFAKTNSFTRGKPTAAVGHYLSSEDLEKTLNFCHTGSNEDIFSTTLGKDEFKKQEINAHRMGPTNDRTKHLYVASEPLQKNADSETPNDTDPGFGAGVVPDIDDDPAEPILYENPADASTSEKPDEANSASTDNPANNEVGDAPNSPNSTEKPKPPEPAPTKSSAPSEPNKPTETKIPLPIPWMMFVAGIFIGLGFMFPFCWLVGLVLLSGDFAGLGMNLVKINKKEKNKDKKLSKKKERQAKFKKFKEKIQSKIKDNVRYARNTKALKQVYKSSPTKQAAPEIATLLENDDRKNTYFVQGKDIFENLGNLNTFTELEKFPVVRAKFEQVKTLNNAERKRINNYVRVNYDGTIDLETLTENQIQESSSLSEPQKTELASLKKRLDGIIEREKTIDNEISTLDTSKSDIEKSISARENKINKLEKQITAVEEVGIKYDSHTEHYAEMMRNEGTSYPTSFSSEDYEAEKNDVIAGFDAFDQAVKTFNKINAESKAVNNRIVECLNTAEANANQLIAEIEGSRERTV